MEKFFKICRLIELICCGTLTISFSTLMLYQMNVLDRTSNVPLTYFVFGVFVVSSFVGIFCMAMQQLFIETTNEDYSNKE
jgi:hypothetical protein